MGFQEKFFWILPLTITCVVQFGTLKPCIIVHNILFIVHTVKLIRHASYFHFNSRSFLNYSSQDVLEEPRLCCEGHAFCKGCIEAYLIEHHNRCCPNDRSPLMPADLRRVLNLQGFLENQHVKCPERADEISGTNCSWEGRLAGVRQHLEECLYVEVCCQYPGCGHRCERRLIADHETNCDHAEATCHQCGRQELRRMDIEDHISFSCPRSSIVCPLSCQTSIIR